VLWRFVRSEHHHPYETVLKAFFRLTGCLCEYWRLHFENLLELNSAMAVRIGDN